MLDQRSLRHISRISRQLHSRCHSSCTGSYGQGITTFVFRMPSMPLDPMKSHPMLLHQRQKTHPQVRVLDLGKTLALPVLQPAFVDGIHDVGRVTVNMHLGIIPSDGLQASDHGQEFHSVICRKAESFRHFHLPSRTLQNHPIASRAWVSA